MNNAPVQYYNRTAGTSHARILSPCFSKAPQPTAGRPELTRFLMLNVLVPNHPIRLSFLPGSCIRSQAPRASASASDPKITTPFNGRYAAVYFSPFLRIRRLPCKHLHNTIAATADNPLAVLAPDDGANSLAAHDAVARNLLRAGSLLKTPEPQGGVVAGADELTAIWTERKARDRCRVSEHVVRTLP